MDTKRLVGGYAVIEGKHCAMFTEQRGNTESQHMECFPTKKELETKMHIWENYEIYEELASR